MVAGGQSATRLETPALYLHVRLEPGAEWEEEVPEDFCTLVYILGSALRVGDSAAAAGEGEALVLVGGDRVRVRTDEGAEVILLAGRPHGEPIRMRGPFVD